MAFPAKTNLKSAVRKNIRLSSPLESSGDIATEAIMNIALNRFSLALAASLLSATALAGSANAQDEGLVVYNAQHESLGREWIDAFTKETGIKVTMRQGSDMQFANQIIQKATPLQLTYS